jgi:hypothetical protein
VTLRPDTRYFWRVEARTGFGRGLESELMEFRLSGNDNP